MDLGLDVIAVAGFILSLILTVNELNKSRKKVKVWFTEDIDWINIEEGNILWSSLGFQIANKGTRPVQIIKMVLDIGGRKITLTSQAFINPLATSFELLDGQGKIGSLDIEGIKRFIEVNNIHGPIKLRLILHSSEGRKYQTKAISFNSEYRQSKKDFEKTHRQKLA